MKVPEEGLIIVGGVYYGISETWFAKNNFNKDTLYFSIEIPAGVTKIANNGFRSNYTSDKRKNGAVTTNDYKVVSIDFSNATDLTTIGYQAAKYEPLQGVLDLSKTKIKKIEKNAFGDCTSLTGVILPNTLEVLGDEKGTSGSVFNGCTGLQFIRTVGSNEDIVFELPKSLKVIGKQTFKNTFPKGSDIIVKIPESVEIIGSEAFYSNSCFSQIFIERQQGFDGYDSDAFKANSTQDALLIFLDADGYKKSKSSYTRITKTYPVVLKFMNNSEVVAEQTKLYGQKIGYEYDHDAEKWILNEDYKLPEAPETKKIPGFDVGWRIYGDTKVLTNTSKVSGWQDDELKVEIDNNTIVSKPVVQYKVGDQIMEDATGVPSFTVEFSENKPAYVGVEVTHPLATEEAKAKGTYVYYKYCWWDEYENGVNGPRSIEEPDLFSNAENSTKYNRKYTDQTMIPMRNEADTRVGGNYYLVEIYGYYVEGNGTPKQYYKSAHNFIAGDNATANECFLMEVNVKEKAQEYFDIAATTDGRGSITPSGTVSVKKGENQTFTVTPNSGYEIEDVLVDGNSVGVVKSYTFENVTANHTIHATFKEKEERGGGSSSGGSHTSNTYYVRYHNDDDIVKDGRFIPGETVTVRGDIFTAPRGKVLAGWRLEENGKVDYKAGDTFRMPGSSYDLYAVWKDAETMTHTAYISGYPDGTVGPDRTITRAEAATMFYNLLSSKNGTVRIFADVPMNQWYANAVTTLAGAGVINGYPDGTFKPDAPITRAEFVTMAMNFAKEDKGAACSFADVPQNMWYYGAVAGATENGWISGYPNGTFGPDRYITRAEVTSVINRMENRAADMTFIVENLKDMRTFSDLPFQHWAYSSMMEAANGHGYIREQENTYEVWTEIK